VSLIPKFSGAKFMETAVIVVVVLIVLDFFPQARFWSRWMRPATGA
jgi:hypothetical protein